MENYLDWQNNLAQDHRIVPLMYVAEYRISPVDKIVNSEEEPVKLCNYTDVYKNIEITSDLDFMDGSASRNEIERFAIQDGDTLITKDSESWNDIGIPAYVKGNFEKTTVCGYHLALIRPYQEVIFPKYLYYCFESKLHRIQLEIEATGVTRFGISKNAIKDYKLPLPSLNKQIIVSDYLDREILKIDTLIAKKKLLIDLLEERKKKIIKQSVNFGLEPDRKMKDSRIPWLGEVPKSWKIVKLKYLSEHIFTGSTPKGYDLPIDETEQEIYNWFTPGDFKSEFNIVDSAKRKLTKHLIDSEGVKLFNEHAVMFVGIGATLGKIAIPNEKFYTNQQINIIELKKDVNKYFIGYFLSAWIDAIRLLANTATLPILNQQRLGDIAISLPHIEEQNSIVEYLERRDEQHSTLLSKITKSISLLKEKRVKIIAANINDDFKD